MFQVVVAALFAQCIECHSANFLNKQKWWVTDELGLTTPPKQEVKVAPAPQLPSFQSVKDGVILSSAFGKKTAALCQQATADDAPSCRRIAGERLFCALMKRHEKQYVNYAGAKEEFEKCKEVDIMQTAVEAAKEERLVA